MQTKIHLNIIHCTYKSNTLYVHNTIGLALFFILNGIIFILNAYIS